ncbi:MAG: hypothetical protein WAR24_24760 [Candidatus Acidiferrales bacterium]
MSADQSVSPAGHSTSEFTIHINDAIFKVAVGSMTGTELRNLPTPPVGPAFDLWEDVPGGSDVLIADSQDVALKNGMHFFTAPATINPGVA